MKARIKFSKYGSMKFIGHLDVMRYFQKVFRRAGIAVEYSKGYSPHQLISFAAPLGVGLTSDGEYLDIQLSSSESSEEMVRIINEEMADGMRLTQFRLLDENSKNAMSIVAGADYKISVKDGYESKDAVFLYGDFKEKWKEFFMQPQINIMKKTKKSEKIVDIKPMIYQAAVSLDEFDTVKDAAGTEELYENGITAYLQLATGSVENLKPELVMEAFCEFINIEYEPFAYQIHRMETYADIDINNRKLVSLGDLAQDMPVSSDEEAAQQA